jgi:hypothetical protein
MSLDEILGMIYKEFWDHEADKFCNIHNYDMSVVLRPFGQEVGRCGLCLEPWIAFFFCNYEI